MSSLLCDKIRKPITVLVCSFLACVWISANSTDLVAQESFENFRITKIRKPGVLKTISSLSEFQENQQESMAEISGTLMDGQSLIKPIMDIQLNVVDEKEPRPEDLSAQKRQLNYGRDFPGNFQNRIASWCAPNIRYQPLYFENVGLERYGYNPHGDIWQPAASALHFGTSFAILPVSTIREHPADCTWPLGFCRPGSLSPQIRNRWWLWR